MYPPGEYDLAGFSVGAVEKAALIDGTKIAAGDAIIGIDSSGPHSNGYSLIRKILARAGITPESGGFDLDLGGTRLADALLAPTTIYVKPILVLLGLGSGSSRLPSPLSPLPLHGMAHITGGGLTENIIRVVPDDLGIALDSSTWKPPAVFDWLQREGNVPQGEMWRTFNCGIGYTLIVGRDDAPATIATLTSLGLTARTVGEIVPARGEQRVQIR
jgi:phosphoribosylformylglycinamidine cyclo-ligase